MGFRRIILPMLALLAAGVLALQSRTPQVAQAESATVPEFWKSGITLEGSAPYSATAGRRLTETAAFRSDANSDFYFVFPASADARTLQSARFMLLDRSGTYSGSANITLEILSFDGSLVHTATASPVDLVVNDLGSWSALTLSDTIANLTIQPGEFLAVHCNFTDGAVDDQILFPIFEISVQ
jgi:hypothetical protein